ncbi:MAG: C40 family peptidase [Mogibacterium sp.]|nr:C40 family peptidase [Mogibacterium sp.]
MKNTGYRHYIRVMLALMLCVMLLPFSAFAEGGEEGAAGNTDGQTVTEVADTGSSTDSGTPSDTTQGTDQSGSDVVADPQNDSAAGTDTTGTDTAQEIAGTDAVGTATAGSEDPAVVTGAEQAAESSQEVQDPEPAQEPAPAPVAAPPRKAKTLVWTGSKLQFKTWNVLIDNPLNAKAGSVHAWITGQKKSMKVIWKKAADLSAIDGYIILRRIGNASVYTEIAKVAKTATSYTDKKAKKKNTAYSYVVVGYKKVGNDIRIAPASNWAAGETTKSKLKNGYSATISNKTLTRQKGETYKLSLKHAKKKTFWASSIRWVSSNKNVLTVDKTGKLTAVGPGTANVTARVASGRDFICKVTVVAAYKPGKPTLSLEYSNTESIELSWGKTSHATSYDLYCSEDGGATYEKVTNTKSCGYTHTGLTEAHEYKYYLQARNDNRGSTALSDKSAVLTQKAVKTPRKTTVSGFPSSASPKAASHYTVTVSVKAPDGRTAQLQMYENSKWVNKKSITLPAGAGVSSVSLAFPDNWWKLNSSTWRLYIPASADAAAYTSGKLVIKTTRRYQNPKGYVQITNSISKHGYSYYTAPVLVNNMSTKDDHIEAMIKTAYKYLGDPYVVCQSRAPGKGVDCSGLVMQACYGAGVDLWPSNPHRHRSPAYEYESRNIAKMSNLKTVSYSNRKRGDLIFYANSSGVVIHVAIYLGNNKIIHSALAGVKVTGMSYEYGTVCKVKRIFN